MSRPQLRGAERGVFLLGVFLVLAVQGWLLIRLDAAAPSSTVPSAADQPPAIASPPPTVPMGSNFLLVTVDDHGLTPPRAMASATTPLNLYVRNQTSRAVDIRLRRKEEGLIRQISAAPGQQESLTAKLPAGVYVLEGDGLDQTTIIESK